MWRAMAAAVLAEGDAQAAIAQLSAFLMTNVNHFDISMSQCGIRKDRAIADDKRWMIRGVDREIRNAVKNAAKTEGVSVGTWVRRSLVRALDATADGPANVIELSEHMRVLEARLSVLENSHRSLHQEVHIADRLTTKFESKKQTRWRRTKKSK